MKKVNIEEFRSEFDGYLECVREGETITLCERNKPFAELKPLEQENAPSGKRPLGLYEGQVVLAPDFDSDEVNEQIAKTFVADTET